MITYWQQENGKLIKKEKNELDQRKNVWLDARSVSSEDVQVLEKEYNILQEDLLDILDQDELSRIDQNDDYTLIIVRLPMYLPETDINYFTIPLGIILAKNTIITICWMECEVIKDITENKVRNIQLSDFPAFTVKILSRGDLTYLRYLKEINRRSTHIQNELQRSIKNNELIQLLNLEKSLVFFTTSLKSNQLLLEKLSKTRIVRFDGEDREWLEDVEIDNRQAIEMAETYSDILSGMMDAFASVISNNLNIIMKKLTIISLVLMVPTLIVSFFGMNVPLPFSQSGWLGITVIICGSIIAAITAYILLSDKPVKKIKEQTKKQPHL